MSDGDPGSADGDPGDPSSGVTANSLAGQNATAAFGNTNSPSSQGFGGFGSNMGAVSNASVGFNGFNDGFSGNVGGPSPGGFGGEAGPGSGFGGLAGQGSVTGEPGGSASGSAGQGGSSGFGGASNGSPGSSMGSAGAEGPGPTGAMGSVAGSTLGNYGGANPGLSNAQNQFHGNSTLNNVAATVIGHQLAVYAQKLNDPDVTKLVNRINAQPLHGSQVGQGPQGVATPMSVAQAIQNSKLAPNVIGQLDAVLRGQQAQTVLGHGIGSDAVAGNTANAGTPSIAASPSVHAAVNTAMNNLGQPAIADPGAAPASPVATPHNITVHAAAPSYAHGGATGTDSHGNASVGTNSLGQTANNPMALGGHLTGNLPNMLDFGATRGAFPETPQSAGTPEGQIQPTTTPFNALNPPINYNDLGAIADPGPGTKDAPYNPYHYIGNYHGFAGKV